jgi:hypothetical protein
MQYLKLISVAAGGQQEILQQAAKEIRERNMLQ